MLSWVMGRFCVCCEGFKAILKETSNNKRGAFIAFEGCDKCGKTTQSNLLAEYLRQQNVPVEHLVFPDRTTPSGMIIDSYLGGNCNVDTHSILLMFAANRWEKYNYIESLLKAGTTVIVDRYSYSGVAYGVARGLDLQWCIAAENGMIRPDRVYFLDADVDTFAARANYGKERFEYAKFQQRVMNVFTQLCESEKKYWLKLDAKHFIYNIHELIRHDSMSVIQKATTLPLRHLRGAHKSYK